MKAFVAGSTGETGRRIVQELLQRQIPVKALVRDPQTAPSILPPEVEQVQGDVTQPSTLLSGMADCTVVLCATGARPSLDPTGPYMVDCVGTKHLVDCAKQLSIQHFVLVSSLCVSQLFHPLNLFWLVLFWKRQAEIYLENSGLTYTIVRPGGLLNDEVPDPIYAAGADTLFEGRIARAQVAQVCVEALVQPQARSKIIEIVARPGAEAVPLPELFARV